MSIFFCKRQSEWSNHCAITTTTPEGVHTMTDILQCLYMIVLLPINTNTIKMDCTLWSVNNKSHFVGARNFKIITIPFYIHKKIIPTKLMS